MIKVLKRKESRELVVTVNPMGVAIQWVTSPTPIRGRSVTNYIAVSILSWLWGGCVVFFVFTRFPPSMALKSDSHYQFLQINFCPPHPIPLHQLILVGWYFTLF